MLCLGFECLFCFFFLYSGDHQDLHLSIRRQRQMCIRDSFSIYERTFMPRKVASIYDPSLLIRNISMLHIRWDEVIKYFYVFDFILRHIFTKVLCHLWIVTYDHITGSKPHRITTPSSLSLIHIWRCRRIERCRLPLLPHPYKKKIRRGTSLPTSHQKKHNNQ